MVVYGSCLGLECGFGFVKMWKKGNFLENFEIIFGFFL